jgi:vancomycin aglycone glucosyltransferase
MRIAIAVEGTRGDVHPMLALGGRLRDLGHDVRVCLPPDFAAEAAAHGLEHRAVGLDVRALLHEEAGALHGGALAVANAARRIFRRSLERQFRDLPEACAGAQLVIAAGTQAAAGSVAEAIGARYHYIAYYPAFFPTREHPPVFVPYQRMPRWLNRLAWWVGDRLMELALRAGVDDGRAELGLPRYRDLYHLVLGDAPLLAADPELAPPPADTPYAVRSVGCLHPFAEEPLPPKLEAFLEAGPPPVYLGFGSMTDPDPARTTRCLLEALERAGLRAVVSEGWAGLGGGALPEGVLAIGAVSHAALFRRVAAVVHHGGAGTTTTAARAGAPQIVVPHVLDQFWWARRVVELGLGPPGIPRRRMSTERLCEALRSLADNELLAERAAAFGERLRSALRAREDPAALLTRCL